MDSHGLLFSCLGFWKLFLYHDAMSTPLNSESISTALKNLPDWKHYENKLTKTILFRDFRESMGFLMEMAFECESANHHPEIYQVYNRLRLELTTHDAGGRVTQKDINLAGTIEAVLAKRVLA